MPRRSPRTAPEWSPSSLSLRDASPSCPAGQVSLLHCVRLLFCRSRAVRVLFPLRGGLLLCPAGSELSLGLGLEPRPPPPPRRRVRPSRDTPRRGPSLFVRSHASDPPPRDARSGPARSGGMAPSARGAIQPPPLRLETLLMRARGVPVQGRRGRLGGGNGSAGA